MGECLGRVWGSACASIPGVSGRVSGRVFVGVSQHYILYLFCVCIYVCIISVCMFSVCMYIYVHLIYITPPSSPYNAGGGGVVFEYLLPESSAPEAQNQ